MPNHLYDGLLGHHTGGPHTFLRLPDGTEWSYEAFASRAGRLATVLSAAGATPGDRVAVQVEKSPDALALTFACIRAGLVVVPLNPAYTTAELAYFLDDAEPAVLVGMPSRAEELGALTDPRGTRLHTLGTDGTGTLPDLAGSATEAAIADRGPDETLAGILYTSGTTGRSKGRC
ncbi:MAG: AMP-binding protein [Acidimicrobiales bacterium]